MIDAIQRILNLYYKNYITADEAITKITNIIKGV